MKFFSASPYSRPLRIGCACLLLATLPLAARADGEWTKFAEIPEQTGNLYFHAPWQPDQGADFRFASPDGSVAAVVTLRRDAIGLAITPRDRLSADTLESRLRSRPNALPAKPMEKAEWTLKVRNREWTLYMEDQRVFVFPPPFAPPAVIFQLATQRPTDDTGRTRFQRTGDFVFEDNFFLPGDTKDALVEWEQVSGAWQLRTAADATTERGARLQQRRGRKPDPERSANFSSLRGEGEPALMLAGHDFYETYSIEAALITAPGEAGLVFYHTYAGAYHALTLTMNDASHTALLRLWRSSGATNAPRETLAAVATELTHDQWVKLKVDIYPNRLQGWLDHTLIIDVATDNLPAGGRFGLFTNSKAGMLFDDLRAQSNRDLDLTGLADMRRHTVASNGEFFPKRRLFKRTPSLEEIPNVLDVASARQHQWLVLGDPDHSRHVFSAHFETPSDSGQIGLILGYRNEQEPYWRFTRTRTPNEEILLLEKTGVEADAVVEELRLPIPEGKGPETISLMADATNDTELRLYRNNVLVLVHHVDPDFLGASGVFVGAGTAARITRPRYRFERDGLHRDQFEKNRVFREDPFMRNWASPEGEWAQDSQGLTWHKGDFYGGFYSRMPYVDGTEIHLSVPEASTNGHFIVRALGGKLTLEAFDEQNKTSRIGAGIPASDLAVDTDEKTKAKTPWFALHYEGHWLWATSGDRLLFKHPLSEPLSGRRMRIAGFSVNDLNHSHVERYNVKDYLFNESLYEWIQNGGEWSVVNRFQCDPRWSHMNGEAPEGLAALWSKFDFKGDFCLEMYAGMRHQFYTRAGDLNITAMSPSRTPGQGYSITCTGWDPDHSQRYTRLYRNGELIEESDVYLVPRHREGQHRRIHDPLIRRGRDLHGAWYYIKLRRTGNRLEYFFDNEPVFSVQEDEPIDIGAFGIWTFMNSMMVARVKMAAEHIVPRPHVFEATPLNATLDDITRREYPADADRHRALLVNGLPAERMLPEYWTADDTTGQTRLHWPNPGEARPHFVAATTLGGGEMLTRAALPPIPYSDLAGWTFKIKRTSAAQFNFHYSLGRMNNKGQYTPEARFFHRISGTDFSKGAFGKSGTSDVPSASAPSDQWHKNEPWTEITVWLPVENETGVGSHDTLYARAEGFGNLQPSYVMQGLHGNGPGEAYAVRAFSEIRTAPPKIGGQIAAATAVIAEGLDKATRPVGTFTNVVDLQTGIDSVTNAGLIRLTLESAATNGVPLHEMSWIRIPETPSVTAEWHPDIPNTIRLVNHAEYPDRRFHAAAVRIGTQTVETWREGHAARLAFVPRRPELTRDKSPSLPLSIALGGTSVPFSLAWSDNPSREPPVLLGLGDAIPFFENFESRKLPAYMQAERQRMRLQHLDPSQGSFLRIANTGRQQRLRSVFPHDSSLARYPILQFRYRAEPMARVSLTLQNHNVIRLSEAFDSARKIRNGHELIADGTWRTWIGMISDAIGEQALNRKALNIQSFSFGSRHAIDQTGLFTQWDLGHIVQSPAVSEQRPLTIVPDYFDFHGVTAVSMAVYSGAEPLEHLDADTLAALDWQDIPNQRESAANLSDLTAGLHRLLLKAKNAAGLESAVTDIPFLYTPRPPDISHSLVQSDHPQHNDSILNIAFNTRSGAPMDIEALQLKWNNEDVPAAVLGSRYAHGPENATLSLNWPYIFRDRIQQTQDGDRFTIVLGSVRDGAGNTADDVLIPMTMDFSRDKTPPTLLRTDYPTNILWHSGWENAANGTRHFQSQEALEIKRPSGEEPYIEHTTKARQSSFWLQFQRARQWQPARHPYLAFHIRLPVIEEKNPPVIFLSLECHGNKTFHIPLAGQTKLGDVVLPLPTPLEWQPNVWQPVTLDLRRILAAVLSDKELNALSVHRLRVSIHSGPKPVQTHLKSIFVFSEWTPTDRVTVNAFDVSGIAEVAWRMEGSAPSMSFSPLGADDALNRWAKARVMDRAGNPSFAWHIPLGPARTGEPAETASP